MKKRYWVVLTIFGVLGAGFVIPEPRVIPVAGASKTDWNKDTFWYEPWGSSGVHEGIDIFSTKGTAVIASSNILVLYRGTLSKGGKVIIGLGPKWRVHYFAHLHEIDNSASLLLRAGDKVGSVGDSGNAKGKPPHLHFSILSLIPMPWAVDSSDKMDTHFIGGGSLHYAALYAAPEPGAMRAKLCLSTRPNFAKHKLGWRSS